MGNRNITYSLFLAGVAAGLVIGTAHLALAKLPCPSDRLHGRSHSVAIASFSIDGVATTVPPDAASPTAVVKTEFYDSPQVVHLEAFDPGATPPIRKLHMTRSQ
jgi:hypothetical protein